MRSSPVIRAAVVATAVLVGAVGCSRSESADRQSPAQSSPTTTTEPPGATTAAASPAAPSLRMGQEVVDGSFAFVVTASHDSEWAGDPANALLRKRAEGMYRVVDLQVTNVGSTPRRFFAADQQLSVRGREVGADNAASVLSNSSMIAIDPGVTATAQLFFDVPFDNVTQPDAAAGGPAVAIELHESASSRGAVVDLAP